MTSESEVAKISGFVGMAPTFHMLWIHASVLQESFYHGSSGRCQVRHLNAVSDSITLGNWGREALCRKPPSRQFPLQIVMNDI
jgi:hypothetical protein